MTRGSTARSRPLIVAYHAVSSTWRSPLAIPEAVLREQLALLHRRGYVGLTFAEAERRRRAATLPARSVVVTFDDGFKSVLRAKPILDELGFPATVFVVTGFVDTPHPLAWPGVETPPAEQSNELAPLGWSDLEALARDGWEIGSHTVGHRLLIDLDDREVSEELKASRQTIAERVGACETLAYPYGLADARVAAAARAAGYLAACSLTRAHLVDEPHLRPRVHLSAEDGGLRLKALLSPPGLRLRRSRLLGRLEPGDRRPSWLPPAPSEEDAPARSRDASMPVARRIDRRAPASERRAKRRRLAASIGALAVSLAVLLLLAASREPAVAKPRPAVPLVPKHGVLFGAYVNPENLPYPGTVDPYVRATLDLEARLGRKLDIIQYFYSWLDQPAAAETEGWVLKRGSIPLVSWSGTKLKPIANGRYDRWIRTRARAFKALRKPVFLRPLLEMNGDWFEWSGAKNGANVQATKLFRSAWRRIHRIFREERVTNVVWVWCPNWASVPNEKWNHPMNYYPGDEYVDWVGIDAYNFGYDWFSWDQLLRPRHLPSIYKAFAGRKPIMLAEVGSGEAWDGAPGSKASWIRHTHRRMKSAYPSIRAFVWFHVRLDEAGVWDIRADSSEEAFAAFKAMALDPYFRPRDRATGG